MQADRQMTSYRRGREPSDSASWRTIYTYCSLSPTAISANFSTSIAPTKRSGVALSKVFMPSPGLFWKAFTKMIVDRCRISSGAHESGHLVPRVPGAVALGYVLKSDLAQCLFKAVNDASKRNRFLSPK